MKNTNHIDKQEKKYLEYRSKFPLSFSESKDFTYNNNIIPYGYIQEPECEGAGYGMVELQEQLKILLAMKKQSS